MAKVDHVQPRLCVGGCTVAMLVSVKVAPSGQRFRVRNKQQLQKHPNVDSTHLHPFEWLPPWGLTVGLAVGA
jgi:hypothetical protein